MQLGGFLGFHPIAVEPGRIEARLPLRDQLMTAAGDFLHAGTVVAFADSCAAGDPSARSLTTPPVAPPRS